MTTKPRDVILEIQGRMGLITLNRANALNALSLSMVRDLTTALLAWRDEPQVLAIAIRGMGKDKTTETGVAPFGAFCAGGDIRFFHQAALAGDAALGEFFTEEYSLNHLIHTYPKPFIAMMDGIVMGGGMGLAQGASLRIVTERTRMAMPETAIGLFPDVGGGYFLSRCAGRIGEYLGLSGDTIHGRQAVAWGLADGYVESQQLANIWARIAQTPFETGDAVEHWITTQFIANYERQPAERGDIDAVFGLSTVPDMLAKLDAMAATSSAAATTHTASSTAPSTSPSTAAQTRPHSGADWASKLATTLRQRSPLMLHVVLEQIRRARHQSLADDLRLERDMVHHCFHLRPGPASETVEGIRALAIDKDHQPKWNPASVEEVTPAEVAAFFFSPWTPGEHPLRGL
jgi:enoyl-CoA hydratase/carnithine racemase